MMKNGDGARGLDHLTMEIPTPNEGRSEQPSEKLSQDAERVLSQEEMLRARWSQMGEVARSAAELDAAEALRATGAEKLENPEIPQMTEAGRVENPGNSRSRVIEGLVENGTTGGRTGEKNANRKARAKMLVLGAVGVVTLAAVATGIFINNQKEKNAVPETNAVESQAEFEDNEVEKKTVDVSFYTINNETGERTDYNDQQIELGENSIELGDNKLFDAEVREKGSDYVNPMLKESKNAYGPILLAQEIDPNGDMEQAKAEWIEARIQRMAEDAPSLAIGLIEAGVTLEGEQIEEMSSVVLNENLKMLYYMDKDGRQAVYENAAEALADQYENKEITYTMFPANKNYMSTSVAKVEDGNGEDDILQIINNKDCSHSKEFAVFAAVDEEGNRTCDQGQNKLNILKAADEVDSKLTLEEAEKSGVMNKYTVWGWRNKCGGFQWVITKKTAKKTVAPAAATEQVEKKATAQTVSAQQENTGSETPGDTPGDKPGDNPGDEPGDNPEPTPTPEPEPGLAGKTDKNVEMPEGLQPKGVQEVSAEELVGNDYTVTYSNEQTGTVDGNKTEGSQVVDNPGEGWSADAGNAPGAQVIEKQEVKDESNQDTDAGSGARGDATKADSNSELAAALKAAAEGK